MASLETYLLAGGTLLALSVIASKATGRLGVPALLVFLVVGMAAGSEGVLGIGFDSAFVAQSLGVVALIFILFAGGLDTEWDSIRPVLAPGVSLATVGVLLTGLLTGLAARQLLGFEWKEALLLGAIVSSTDAAAVFAVLRARNVSLKGRIKPLLELESGSNDPMAVFLTVGILHLMTHGNVAPAALVPAFFQQMTVGAAMGLVGGKGIAWLLNRVRLEFEGLYSVLTIGLVLLVYAGSQELGGNGFLAVYLAGLLLGRERFIEKKSLTLFHDGLAWLMQIAMFLTLGLLVFPSKLVPVAGTGLLLSGILILVARPVGVFVSLVGSGFTARDKLMISWVGLRGALPIILATFPLIAGVAKADVIFNLVFFIVLTSVLIQGTSIPLVSGWLGLRAAAKPRFRYPLEFVPTGDVKNDLVEIEVPSGSATVGKSVIELPLPKDSLIVLLQRAGQVTVPRGGTRIEADDRLLVFANRENLKEIRAALQKRRE